MVPNVWGASAGRNWHPAGRVLGIYRARRAADQQLLAYIIQQMERIRIRSMLNYLKKTQVLESDLKLAEVEPKSSTDDSFSQIISNSSRDYEPENTQYHKLKSFTLDSNQLEGNTNTRTIDLVPSEEIFNLAHVPEGKRKKTPVRCLAQGLGQRRRSYSQNLQQLGIAKKALTSRKICHQQRLISNFSGENPGKCDLSAEGSGQSQHSRELAKYGKYTFDQRFKQRIINMQQNQNSTNDQKKGRSLGKIRIRNMRNKEKEDKIARSPQQQICPWNTQQQSTCLYYTIN